VGIHYSKGLTVVLGIHYLRQLTVASDWPTTATTFAPMILPPDIIELLVSANTCYKRRALLCVKTGCGKLAVVQMVATILKGIHIILWVAIQRVSLWAVLLLEEMLMYALSTGEI
jgi:hypothetical protein